jgi:tetratricopeptide (TPR) repeat protein
MYVAGVSILALIVYIVSLSLQSPSLPASGGPAGASPAGWVPSAGGGDHIATLEQAVRDRANDPDALLALANGLHDHRDWGRAIETYQKFLQKNPGDPDARVDMGICYFELSRAQPERAEEYFAKAVREMETALKKSPGHVPAAFNLGVIYLQRGAVQQSNEWFRRAIGMDKNHPLAQRAQRMLEQHSFSN